MQKLQIFYQVFGIFFFLLFNYSVDVVKFIFPVILLQVCSISEMCVLERRKHFHPNQVCTYPLFFRHLNYGKTEEN